MSLGWSYDMSPNFDMFDAVLLDYLQKDRLYYKKSQSGIKSKNLNLKNLQNLFTGIL